MLYCDNSNVTQTTLNQCFESYRYKYMFYEANNILHNIFVQFPQMQLPIWFSYKICIGKQNVEPKFLRRMGIKLKIYYKIS